MERSDFEEEKSTRIGFMEVVVQLINSSKMDEILGSL